MKRITRTALLFFGVAILSFGSNACTERYKPVLNSQQGINFKVTSFAAAKELAKSENKPLFIFLHATWCPTCKKMEREVLIQKELGDSYNRQFVNVAIDYDSPEGHQLNEQYPIKATPTLFFFKPDGSVFKKLEGFTTASELLAEAKSLAN